MRNKVLVTGATGFVGRALCARLVASGNDVIGVGRSEGLMVPSGVAYYPTELEVDDLREMLSGDVDCVIHLAGQAHGKGGSERQELNGFLCANVDVSLRLAREAIESGVRRFVFVSTIGVHGTVTHGEPITEVTPFNPGSPYAVSKREAEIKLTKLFEESASSELTIVRPPLVYGLSAPGNFGRLLRLADSSIPLPFGLCSNRRNLVSLAGLVNFLVACIDHPQAGGQSFVVADSYVVSTKDIVASLRTGMARAGRLVPVPPVVMAATLRLLGKREMYNQLFCDLEIDSRKARNLLDWMPCENTVEELETIGKRYADSCI